jgi:hypothetical protein
MWKGQRGGRTFFAVDFFAVPATFGSHLKSLSEVFVQALRCRLMRRSTP